MAALELTVDGTGLYAGCDAASPKRDPDVADLAPVKLLAVEVRHCAGQALMLAAP